MQFVSKSDMWNRISEAFCVNEFYVEFFIALHGEESSGRGYLIPFVARICTIRMPSRSPKSVGNLRSYCRFCVFAKIGPFPFFPDHDDQEHGCLAIGMIYHAHYVTHA